MNEYEAALHDGLMAVMRTLVQMGADRKALIKQLQLYQNDRDKWGHETASATIGLWIKGLNGEGTFLGVTAKSPEEL